MGPAVSQLDAKGECNFILRNQSLCPSSTWTPTPNQSLKREVKNKKQEILATSPCLPCMDFFSPYVYSSSHSLLLFLITLSFVRNGGESDLRRGCICARENKNNKKTCSKKQKTSSRFAWYNNRSIQASTIYCPRPRNNSRRTSRYLQDTLTPF
jgi:hypothetical protein